jgi:hypothetical protein
MLPWPGQRRLTVVTACLNATGMPDFALTEVEITHEEYANGVHCDRVEEQLRQHGYDEPFLHFDLDAPPFLVPAVKQYLGTRGEVSDSVVS